jgi:hypothetical protein
MSESIHISKQELRLITAYNRVHNVHTYVIYTAPEFAKFGGVSSQFIEFSEKDDDYVLLKDASGRLYTVPFATVTIRVEF